MVLLKGYKMVKRIINNEPLLYRIQWLYKWRKPPKIFCYGIWHFSCHMCQFSLKLAPRLMMVSCDCQKHSEGCAERARGRGGEASLPQTSALMSFCNSHSTIKSELVNAREKIGKKWYGGLIFHFPTYPVQCSDLSASVNFAGKWRRHLTGIQSMTSWSFIFWKKWNILHYNPCVQKCLGLFELGSRVEPLEGVT